MSKNNKSLFQKELFREALTQSFVKLNPKKSIITTVSLIAGKICFFILFICFNRDEAISSCCC